MPPRETRQVSARYFIAPQQRDTKSHQFKMRRGDFQRDMGKLFALDLFDFCAGVT
jgi:hypothetical protein